MKHDARITHKPTSGGTAAVETIDPGGMHEMVIVIHKDGGRQGSGENGIRDEAQEMNAEPDGCAQ